MTAVIGVSSARPSAPFLAVGSIGQDQLHELEKILADTGRQRLFRIVLIHHPPMPSTVSWHKRLTDGVAFRSILARHGAELILHGHAHRTSLTQLETCTGMTPAVGVPSASAIGRKAERCARYHLYRLSRNVQGWDVQVSVRRYSLADDRFVANGIRHLMLPRQVG